MIPKDWSSITIEQFVSLKPTLEIEVEDSIHDLNLGLERYKILTNNHKANESNVYLKDLEEIKRLLTSKMPSAIKEDFELNGIKYRVLLNPEKLPAVDYITIMNLAKLGDDNLHQIIFTICKPLVKKRGRWVTYDFEPWELKERIEDFKQLTMDVVNPIRLFFSSASIALTDLILAYSEKEVKNQEKKIEEAIQYLEENTVG